MEPDVMHTPILGIRMDCCITGSWSVASFSVFVPFFLHALASVAVRLQRLSDQKLNIRILRTPLSNSLSLRHRLRRELASCSLLLVAGQG